MSDPRFVRRDTPHPTTGEVYSMPVIEYEGKAWVTTPDAGDDPAVFAEAVESIQRSIIGDELDRWHQSVLDPDADLEDASRRLWAIFSDCILRYGTEQTEKAVGMFLGGIARDADKVRLFASEIV